MTDTETVDELISELVRMKELHGGDTTVRVSDDGELYRMQPKYEDNTVVL